MLMAMTDTIAPRTERFAPYLSRYRAGEWRAPIMHDLIAEDVRAAGQASTVLDIGCGKGLDDDLSLQRSLAAMCGSYVGVEPDPAVELGAYFSTVHRSILEEAEIPASSIDVAVAVMVLEHLEKPELFWDKLHHCLKPGGVFWGFTVDGRSLFCLASQMTERLRIKELYLHWLYGARGDTRYLNYPVFYRNNTPEQLAAHTQRFASCETFSFAREGQHRPTMPRPLHGVADRFDRWVVANDKPGTLLAVRVVR